MGDSAGSIGPTDDTPLIVLPDREVWTITINRPRQLNAVDPGTLDFLRKALISFRDDSLARVLIITGTGDTSFCSGADMRATLPTEASFASAVFEPDERSIQQGNYIRGLDIARLNLGKPVVAAING